MHSLSLHGVHSLQVSVYLCVQAVHVWQVVFYLTGSQLTHDLLPALPLQLLTFSRSLLTLGQ